MAIDRGVLITAPNGRIYHIPAEALEGFRVPPEELESTIASAEERGFVLPPEVDETLESAELPETEEGGSTVARHAAGSTVARHAAGSTVARHAAGSTIARHAAGSTVTGPGAGSTVAPLPFEGPTGRGSAMFYGEWEPDDPES